VDQAGFYTITVTNTANSCQSSDEVEVTTDTLSPTADASATLSAIITCSSNLVTTLDASNSLGTGLSYAWSTANGTIDSQSGVNATVSSAGDYDLEVTGANGCTDLTSINVTSDTVSPNINISPSDTLNCNITSIIIDASGTIGSNESYQWSSLSGTIVSGDNTSSVSVSSGGTYILTVTNDNGCFTSDSSLVNVNANPIADFTPSVLTGSIPLVVDFTNNSIGNNLTNNWTFGDGNVSIDINPTNTYNELGTYTAELIVIDQFGCTDTAEVIIDASGDYNITIPNIFTPNVDGSNDIFRVDIEYATEFQATIFNRWGQLIYEWDGTDGGWDGYTYSGVLASEGTYYYLFVVTDIKGELHEYQGHFRLAR
jgi:gliding motility-associated-like protein